MQIKTIFQSIAAVTFAIFTLAAHAEATYTESQPNITITSVQPDFTLKLRSNPSTGYSWAIEDYDAKYITPLEHSYQHATAQLPGAGGYELWSFRVNPHAFITSQQTTIRMMYTRPWEKIKRRTELVFHVTTEANH
jgi:inhibitor of cysteine peptidase